MSELGTTYIAFPPGGMVNSIIRLPSTDAGSPDKILKPKNEIIYDFWLQTGGKIIVTMFSANPQEISFPRRHFFIEDSPARSGAFYGGVYKKTKPGRTYIKEAKYDAEKRTFWTPQMAFGVVDDVSDPFIIRGDGFEYCQIARGAAASILEQQIMLINQSNQ